MATEKEIGMREAVATEARRRRLRRIQSAIAVLACGAIIAAAFAFYIAVAQNAHTGARVTRDEYEHCVADAQQSNRQRVLDLALIRADQGVLARLRALPGASVHEALITYYTTALAARQADIPPRADVNSCRPG